MASKVHWALGSLQHLKSVRVEQTTFGSLTNLGPVSPEVVQETLRYFVDCCSGRGCKHSACAVSHGCKAACQLSISPLHGIQRPRFNVLGKEVSGPHVRGAFVRAPSFEGMPSETMDEVHTVFGSSSAKSSYVKHQAWLWQGSLLKLGVIVLGNGCYPEKLITNHDSRISDITRWKLWVDTCEVEPVTQSFTSLLCLLANCDDRAERALVCLLGQGVDNGVSIGSLSPDMLIDVVLRGP